MSPKKVTKIKVTITGPVKPSQKRVPVKLGEVGTWFKSSQAYYDIGKVLTGVALPLDVVARLKKFKQFLGSVPYYTPSLKECVNLAPAKKVKKVTSGK